MAYVADACVVGDVFGTIVALGEGADKLGSTPGVTVTFGI